MSINTNELNTSIEQFGEDMNLVHKWAQGGTAASVVLGGVSTPTIRNLVASFIDGGGVIAYQTKAELDADLAHGENTLAFVSNDSTASKLGWYIKVGASGTGSWKQSTYDRTVTQAQLDGYLDGVQTAITAGNKATTCPTNDINDLPTQKVYIIDQETGLENVPDAFAGAFVRLNRVSEVTSAAVDLYLPRDRNYFYFRQYATSTGWLPWHKVLSEEAMSNFLHGETLITSDNATEICQGDTNNLKPNSIYTVNVAANLAHYPTSNNGMIITLSRNAPSLSAAAIQVYFNQEASAMHVRSYSVSGWTAWKRILYEADKETLLDGRVRLDSSNSASICQNSLGNLETNTVYTVNSSAALDDYPVERDGMVLTLSRGPNRMSALSENLPAASTQLYVTAHNYDSLLFYRYAYSTTQWRKWRAAVPMDRMKLLAVGDSICIGHRNGDRGYVGELGMPYANFGISSWRLSGTDSSVGPIASQLDTFAAAANSSSQYYGFKPDVIIAEGGINDYFGNIPLGTVPTEPTNPSSTDTLIDGLRRLLYKMTTMYPYAQRLFVQVHKMGRTVSGTPQYLPTRRNSAGYNQTEMSEAIAATCHVYGCKVVDVFNESQLDTSFSAYLGDYEANPSTTKWCNVDGIHPLRNGYLHAYCPLIMQALVGGTYKEY